MNNLNKVSHIRETGHGNRSSMIRALEREITCLERQVSRIRVHGSVLNEKTVQTYEEMIEARKYLLGGL